MNAIPTLPSYSSEALAALGPAELADLMVRDEDRVPRNVVIECARRGEPMVEHLSGLPEDDRYWNGEGTPGEWWLLLHAVMILGLIPGERAGLLLLRFMRRMGQEQDDDLQGWLSGYWPALFRNKPLSVFPALRALCEDRSLDWYIRSNAVDAVVAGARGQGAPALDEALAWAATLAADEREDWDFRLCVGNTLLDFPRARYRPLLEDLAQRQTGRGVHFSGEDLRRAYSAVRNEPEWERREDPWRDFYAPVAIERRQERWEKENAELDEDDLEGEAAVPEEAPLPYVRATPKVGRNDPCPCGSGKKYKHCCMKQDGNVVIPPERKGPILELRKRIRASELPLFPGAPAELGMEMLAVYHGIADTLLNPAFPELRNTDGDPLGFHKLVFEIESPRAAFDALKDLALDEDEAALLEEAEFDGQGAQRIRKIVEDRLGAKVKYLATEIQSAQSMLARVEAEGGSGPARAMESEHDRLAGLPEVQARIAEMMRAHCENWVSEKIPALGGKTPLQAVKDPEGREMVEALVLQMERHGRTMTPPLDPAIIRELRARLGLA